MSILKNSYPCECGGLISVKNGKYGSFLGCTNYKSGCKPRQVKTNESCEKCGSPMLLKKGKYGIFCACSNYPTCKNIWKNGIKPLPQKTLQDIQLTSLQQKIYDFVMSSDDNIAVIATAGSGKTTLLQQIIKDYTREYAYIVFGNENANEAKQKINGTVKTIHSYVMGLLPNNYSLDDKKYRSLIESDYPEDIKQQKAILFALEQYFMGKQDINPTLQDLINRADHKMYTLNDLFWLINYKKIELPKIDTLFLDESQDISLDQLIVIEQLAKRFIFVGDDNQAIYIWRGTLENGMSFIANRFNCQIMPLDVTFRFGQDIANFVNSTMGENVVKAVKSGGIVKHHNILTDDLLDNSMVLSRLNAPLFKIARQLLLNGKKFNLLNAEKMKGYFEYVIRSNYAQSSSKFLDNLYQWASEQKNQTTANDTIDVIELFLNDSPSTVLRNIVNFLNSSGDSGTVLSTIHKSKGLQYNRIIVLGYEKLANCKTREDKNILFVAITRAENELHLVN